ncbi:MAG: YggS family pyridoxal phosphate-dependent enzyme [Oscillospiraceae bacterium]|jgi:pyridoxal phosphate enzyme (YggS family)|nr:YggS family pyridoxal phosphate-dependent enzyme [Oscillospiraceae bacterium]
MLANDEYGWVRGQYLRVREQVDEAALRANRRPEEVRLMAVTKTVEEALIREAVAAGADLLGENKVQELARKRGAFAQSEMHLIGHLQSNKAAKAAACADMVQSVDSLRLAAVLSDCCVKLGKRLPVLLEINIGGDAAKFGFPPEEAEAALAEIGQMQGLKVRGLMTVPPISGNPRETAIFFSHMHKLFLDFSGKKMDNITMDILSMGMSGDFAAAIAEGSTLVRVGTAIFGQRDYR